MAPTREEQQYMTGYNAGRTLCLQTGSADAGLAWLDQNASSELAFVAGFEWALWDYSDANGLAAPTLPHGITG